MSLTLTQLGGLALFEDLGRSGEVGSGGAAQDWIAARRWAAGMRVCNFAGDRDCRAG